MLVVPRDGDATMVIPRLEAPRVVEQPGVFTLRPWDETEDPTAIVAELAAGAATAAVGDQMWARFLVELLPQLPGTDVPPGRRRRRAAADGQGRRRDRRPARRRRRRRPGRRPAARRRDPARRAHRGPGVGRHLGPAHRRGPRQGQLRHRRRRRERGQPAPPRRRPGHRAPARSCCATSAARWPATAATSPAACSPATPPAEIAEAYAVLHEAQQAGVAAADGRHAVRGRRPRGPRDHRRRRVRRPLRPPHRPRHRAWRSTRTPTSSRATTARWQPGTRSASSPASTSPGGGGCASRTSSSPRADGPEPLNASDHAPRPASDPSEVPHRCSPERLKRSVPKPRMASAGRLRPRRGGRPRRQLDRRRRRRRCGPAARCRARSTSTRLPASGIATHVAGWPAIVSVRHGRRRRGRPASRRRRVAALDGVEVGRQLRVADPRRRRSCRCTRRCRESHVAVVAPSMRKRTSPTVTDAAAGAGLDDGGRRAQITEPGQHVVVGAERRRRRRVEALEHGVDGRVPVVTGPSASVGRSPVKHPAHRRPRPRSRRAWPGAAEVGEQWAWRRSGYGRRVTQRGHGGSRPWRWRSGSSRRRSGGRRWRR